MALRLFSTAYNSGVYLLEFFELILTLPILSSSLTTALYPFFIAYYSSVRLLEFSKLTLTLYKGAKRL